MKKNIPILGASLLVLTLSACSTLALDDWGSPTAYTVIGNNGHPYLGGVAQSEDLSILADLREVGMRDPADATVYNETTPVLVAWNDMNQPTEFATVDVSSKSVEKVDYSVDSGTFAVVDNHIYSLLPQTEGDATVEVFSIQTAAVTATLDVAGTPSFFVTDAPQATLVGVSDAGTVSSQTISTDGEVGPEVSYSAPGYPGAAVAVGDSLVFTAIEETQATGDSNSSVVLSKTDGRSVTFDGVEDPGLLADDGEQLTMVSDTVKGIRVMRVLDSSTLEQLSEVELELPTAVLGVMSASPGTFIVLQESRVSWIDASNGTVVSTDLEPSSIASWG